MAIVEHQAIKPRPVGFLVYADKKLLTLTPISRGAGRCFVRKLRELHPSKNIELIGIHTMQRSAKEASQ